MVHFLPAFQYPILFSQSGQSVSNSTMKGFLYNAQSVV